MAIPSKPCKLCSSIYHTAFRCPQKPRKPVSKAVKPKKAKSTKPKTKTRSQLVKELDKVFSRYIRLRDDGNGCITCGEVKPWKEMQACHFYTRGRYPTRWDETNVHSGCYRCNVLLKGNYIPYTIYMIDRYGRQYVDDLEKKSKSNTKILTPVIREMIKDYEDRTSGTV